MRPMVIGLFVALLAASAQVALHEIKHSFGKGSEQVCAHNKGPTIADTILLWGCRGHD